VRALSLLLLAGLLTSPSLWADDKSKKATDILRPTGPVTVTADRAEFQQGGLMLYTGNVLLVSDTLKLSGDRLELIQTAEGQYEAKIKGNPAHLDHAGYTDAQGKQFPPVSAQATTLAYNSLNGVVDVQGRARMTRGKDEINGEQILYNALERRIQAAGGENGQVRIVIQPPPPKGADKGAEKSP
jgi:lipopolysaccharide export system protein LptA